MLSRAFVQPGEHELAMPEHLGRGEPAVGGARTSSRAACRPPGRGSSPLQRPETSTSMCSHIVRTVRGLAQSLITGTIGLPITLPWPVGKKWTTKPDAAQA